MRSLFLLILVVIIYYFLKSIFISARKPSGSSGEPKRFRQVDDMVKDPVCDTYIPKSSAPTTVFNGDKFYFCSQECLEKFKKQNQT